MQDINVTLLNVLGAKMTYLIDFIGYLFFSFVGSFIKEFTNANKLEEYQFEPYRVITSTICGAIAAAGIKSVFFPNTQSWEIMTVIGFVCGLLGVKIYKDLSDSNGIKRLIKEIYDIATFKFLADDKSSGTTVTKDNVKDENLSATLPPVTTPVVEKPKDDDSEVLDKPIVTHYHKPTMLVHEEKDEPPS